MELWIRSQDKKRLVKTEHIYYYEDTFTNNELRHYICTIGAYDLGTYKTKERALEVLDEIHSCIQTNELFDIYSKLGTFSDDFNKKYNLVPVYQMPKE